MHLDNLQNLPSASGTMDREQHRCALGHGHDFAQDPVLIRKMTGSSIHPNLPDNSKPGHESFEPGSVVRVSGQSQARMDPASPGDLSIRPLRDGLSLIDCPGHRQDEHVSSRQEFLCRDVGCDVSVTVERWSASIPHGSGTATNSAWPRSHKSRAASEIRTRAGMVRPRAGQRRRCDAQPPTERPPHHRRDWQAASSGHAAKPLGEVHRLIWHTRCKKTPQRTTQGKQSPQCLFASPPLYRAPVSAPARERLSGSLRKRFDSARRRASEQLALRQVKERIRDPCDDTQSLQESVEPMDGRGVCQNGRKRAPAISGKRWVEARESVLENFHPRRARRVSSRDSEGQRNRSERLRLEGSRLGPRCVTTTRKAGKGGGRCADSHALTRFCAPLTIVLSAWLRSRRGVRPSARMAPQKESRPPLSNATTSALSWGSTFAAGGSGTFGGYLQPPRVSAYPMEQIGQQIRIGHGSGSTICTWRPMLRMKLRGRRVRRSPTYAATAESNKIDRGNVSHTQMDKQEPSLASMVPGSSP